MKSKRIKNYVIIDSQNEVLEGLQEVSEKLELVLEDSYQWKWVILALDNLVQNTMVFALRDTAGINILRKKIRPKMVSHVRQNTQRPVEKLDEFLNLYEATKGREMLHYLDSKFYIPKGTEEESIKRMHWYRTEFAHFIPKGWLMYSNEFPDRILDCMNYVRFLIFDTFNSFFLLKSGQVRKIKSYIYRIRKSCKKINIVYQEVRKKQEKKYKRLKKKKRNARLSQ